MELSKGDLIIWVSEVHIVLINCLLKQDNNDYNTDQKKKKKKPLFLLHQKRNIIHCSYAYFILIRMCFIALRCFYLSSSNLFYNLNYLENKTGEF